MRSLEMERGEEWSRIIQVFGKGEPDGSLFRGKVSGSGG